MKEIGGYYELELARKSEYHKKAIKLNSGRNAFKYILISQNIAKVYIPNFICDTMIQPLKELNIKYEFYHINKEFELTKKPKLKENEELLYINYFGIKTDYIKKLVKKYENRIIIDNTQAFFEMPCKNIDTIYSPRKFFGVSDGGYLYTKHILNQNFEIDTSLAYTTQLIGRIEKKASDFYEFYKISEKRLERQPIKIMSNFTKKVLRAIDYVDIKKRRAKNFMYLHKELHKINSFKMNKNNYSVFAYPLLIKDTDIREKLISHKIYLGKYWVEVLNRAETTKTERDFVNNLLLLPIDQRYNLKDMKRIVNVIKGNL